MAVGLTLTARLVGEGERVSQPWLRDWMSRAAAWFEAVGDAVLDAHLQRDADGRPHLLVRCHPAADPFDLRIGTAGKVKMSARTSPAGPGYHAHLAGLMKQFAVDFEFTWEEPPGDHDAGRYFVLGDMQKLETHFRHWLASTCAAVLPRVSVGGGPYAVGLPKRPKYLHPGPVLTPLGPRSLEWLKAVAADEAVGADYFAWRMPSLDAAFYRGRAVCGLWLDFFGRAPLTEAEGELADQIAADLANALDADDTIELPWTAWSEVIDALQADAGQFTVEPIDADVKTMVRDRAAGEAAAPVGYRQHPIRVPLTGGWSIVVPGRFAMQWDDHGQTWSAWEGGRTVWFRGMAVEGQSMDEALAAGRKNLPPGEPLPVRADGTVSGAAVFGPHAENGKGVWRLSGVAAADGRLAACNVYVENEKDRAWAEGVWAGLGRAH